MPIFPSRPPPRLPHVSPMVGYVPEDESSEHCWALPSVHFSPMLPLLFPFPVIQFLSSSPGPPAFSQPGFDVLHPLLLPGCLLSSMFPAAPASHPARLSVVWHEKRTPSQSGCYSNIPASGFHCISVQAAMIIPPMIHSCP